MVSEGVREGARVTGTSFWEADEGERGRSDAVSSLRDSGTFNSYKINEKQGHEVKCAATLLYRQILQSKGNHLGESDIQLKSYSSK